MQNVVIRGKKVDGSELPILVDDNGKIRVVGVTVGDITVDDVTVTSITNKINVDTVDEVTVVDAVTAVDAVTMVDEVDVVNSVSLVDKVTVVDAVTAITDPVAVVLEDEYGFEPEYTPQGEMRTASPVRLVGSTFTGTTVDSNFWTAATGTGGSVAQANNVMTVGTGTNNGNTVTLTSVRSARFVSSVTNRFRGNFRLDSGLSNNARRWGAMSATDGYFFELDGTSLYVVSRKGGADTRVAQASWNGDKTFSMDTNFHTYEIYISFGKVMFVISDKVVHTLTPTTAMYSDTLSLSARVENINQVGVSTNKNIYISNMAIHRLGELRTENNSRFISGANTGVALKLSAGRLVRVQFHPGAQGNVCQLYDSPTTTANQIGELVGSNQPISLSADFDIPFHNGLWVVTTGTNTRVTVVYE